MVDSMANIAEDYLIDSFHLKIPPGASYDTDLRSVSYFTAGSSIYQAVAGTKIARINLAGDGWLDPSTIRLHYTLVNTDSNALRYLRTTGGPWSFFTRVRCLTGGTLVDNVDYYSRVHEMMSILTSTNNRDNDDCEGFCYRWDSYDNYDNLDEPRLMGIAR